MKRLAFHRLILPNGEVVPMAVCEFDDSGRLLSWHTLKGEEPFVEWVGGEYLASREVKSEK